MPQVFVKRSRIPAPVERVFRWHERSESFEKLAPPWEGARVKPGQAWEHAMRPVRVAWVAEPLGLPDGRKGRRQSEARPHPYWRHTRLFEPDGPAACILEDRIEYSLPFGWLGQWLGGWWIRRKLAELFAYRHRVTLQEAVRPSEN